ncbi:AAA family ATPase [Sphingobacterium chungjuense]|uniref:AAA family ATPase n=1 Tax=Sphingobacterium chungjuense TaxID=2675553 RepID=UPI0014081F7B|nr:AAA family ATPase [Sphingobacterium chungjuense]
MKLKLLRPSRSIASLNDIEINDFSIITGINGSGKTHLLNAIEDGSIEVEGVPSSEVIYYNYNDFTIDYNQTSNSIPNQMSAAKRHSQKNGNSIVQGIINQRTQILNNLLFSNLSETDVLIQSVLSRGYNISIIEWLPDEIESYKKFIKLPVDSKEYWKDLDLFSEKIRVIHDTFDTFIPAIVEAGNNMGEYIKRYFRKNIIRSLNYDPTTVAWSDNDIQIYNELKSQDSQFQIWNYEGVLSNNFIRFISIYEDNKTQFVDYMNDDLIKLRDDLLVLFETLRNELQVKLNPAYLTFIKNYSANNDVFYNPQSDSGALDLNQIAEEEKQYQITRNKNTFNKFLSNVESQDVIYYNDEIFTELYGVSPVQLLNEALDKYDCNGYEFRSTEIPKEIGVNFDNYTISLSLYHKSKGFPTDLGSLSSGEKTLLALTFYIYKLQFKKKVVSNILLLDEIASSLHPSMSKRLISVLHNLFFKELGIKIILSTHSPSTVAFAPAGSLYIMKGDGEDRLHASSKDEALDELTFGVPSFSINYENRRQIFVESKYDVEYYEKLYQTFRKELNNEISLNFIASGDVQRNKNGQPKSTCDQVITITELLRDSGNKFIWGIIDWDLNVKRPKSEHVRVLGWEERYSIENFVLDPLLIAILLMTEKIKKPEFFNLPEDFKIYDIIRCSDGELAAIIEVILKIINEELKIDITDEIEYKTFGGKKLKLPKAFVEYNGHKLEEKYLKVIPELNKFKRDGEEALKLAVLDKVIDVYTELVPMGLLNILKEVQKV